MTKFQFFCYFVFISCCVISGCNNSRRSGEVQIVESELPSVEVRMLNPLEEGEVTFSEKDFGKIIELTGQTHELNELFTVSSSEMVIKGNMLFLNNRLPNGDNISVYRLPEFEFIRSIARTGRGPGEFKYIHIFKAESDSIYIYLYEMMGDKLFYVNKNLEIKEILSQSRSSSSTSFSLKEYQTLYDSVFVYVNSTSTGKAIFKQIIHKDTISDVQIYNLAFSTRYKGWASYTGDFGVNAMDSRMVYAYKYFKRLLFVDTKTGKMRNLIFNEMDVEIKDNIGTLGPDNVTYYWGMSVNNDYVYSLYSGRTPIKVKSENDRGIHYIFVEQYDWNGNPIRKFKLDNWGYFCVDEERGKIYLLSTTAEHPLVIYDLPPLSLLLYN